MKTECGCPSGGGIKNGHIRYLCYGGTQKEKKEALEREGSIPPIGYDIMIMKNFNDMHFAEATHAGKRKSRNPCICTRFSYDINCETTLIFSKVQTTFSVDGVTQVVERLTRDPKTRGSNPAYVSSTRTICESFFESKCCADSLSVCPPPVCTRTLKNDHVRK